MIPENLKLAAALDEMGRLLFLSGAQRFRVRAYHQAARSIADADVDVVAETRSRGVPSGLRGVGPRLSALIHRYAEDGDLPGLEELQRELTTDQRAQLLAKLQDEMGRREGNKAVPPENC